LSAAALLLLYFWMLECLHNVVCRLCQSVVCVRRGWKHVDGIERRCAVVRKVRLPSV